MRHLRVTHTWLRSPLHPKIPLWAAYAIQAQASRIQEDSVCDSSSWHGKVVGYTTPAVLDVGGQSLRIKLSKQQENGILQHPTQGGYLLAIRPQEMHTNSPKFHWIPAIAGVPGTKGKDRFGSSRLGLAEIMLLGRPVIDRNSLSSTETSRNDKKYLKYSTAQNVTFLPEEILQTLFPVGSSVELAFLYRATDFFLGLNAGRWLTIRMSEICKEGCEKLKDHISTQNAHDSWPVRGMVNEGEPLRENPLLQEVLERSGLRMSLEVQEPPSDASYLFEYWAVGGNGGLSGQTIIKSEDESF